MTEASSSNHHGPYLHSRLSLILKVSYIKHFMFLPYFNHFSWVLDLFPIKKASAVKILVLITAFCYAATARVWG